ncbi:MAG: nickel pincer cofactor biosynthesis protein LarB [Gemmatimonadales bacterium]
MRREQLADLLAELAAGRLSPADALERLRHFPTEQLDFAQLDHHRALRQGHPEVVFCGGKTVDQVVAICRRLAAASGTFLGTRATAEQAGALAREFPGLEHNGLARTVFLPSATGRESFRARPPALAATGTVLVICAGTSDLPVAEEAAVVASAFGHPVERLTDVGVAGLHRLLAATEQLARAAVVIVVAGMEGALPSVVGGLVSAPVIAVPTSVGYGASFGGVAALLGMLNSCAAGVTVVNIDNGFGAAAAASRILRGD